MVLAAAVLLWGGWWTLVCLVALRWPRAAASSADGYRFAVLVPAHNEERLIGACLDSLNAAAAHADAEVVVIADNCTDATAGVARGRGATVLERVSDERGKGYALEWANRGAGAPGVTTGRRRVRRRGH